MLCPGARLRTSLYIRMSACRHKKRRRLACLQALREFRQSFRRCGLRLCSLGLGRLRRGIHLTGALEVLEIAGGEVWLIVEGRRESISHAQSLAGDKEWCGT